MSSFDKKKEFLYNFTPDFCEKMLDTIDKIVFTAELYGNNSSETIQFIQSVLSHEYWIYYLENAIPLYIKNGRNSVCLDCYVSNFGMNEESADAIIAHIKCAEQCDNSINKMLDDLIDKKYTRVNDS